MSEDVATIIINLMKEQGRVCDDCGSPDIQTCSMPIRADSEDDRPFAPGEYVQKCFCGPCFIKRVQKPRH